MTTIASSHHQRLSHVWAALAAISTDLSLDKLLQRIVAEAAQLIDARVGVIDVVQVGIDPRLERLVMVGAEPTPQHASSRDQLVHLMAEAPAVDDGFAFVGLPIQVNGITFGNLYLLDPVGGTFSFEDEQIAGVFATAAGAVIGAALAQASAERDRRWLEATTDIAAILLGGVSHEVAWQLIVDRALDVSDAACAMLLLTRDDGDLHVEAVAGVPAGGVLGTTVAMEGTLIGDVARSGDVRVVADTDLEERYDPELTRAWPDLTAMQVLPMRNDGAPGALVVGWRRGDAVTDSDLDPELPQRYVDQAALVLEMANRREDKRRLAVLEDRARISRDIHDVVIQRLYGIGMSLDNVRWQESAAESSADATHADPASTIAAAVTALDDTIRELRRTIYGLASAEADNVDVPHLLERLVDDASGLLGYRPSLTIHGPVSTQTSNEIAHHVVAVAAELVSNAVQHAEATELSVSLNVDESVTLVVADNGNGLDSGTPEVQQVASGTGNGLHNIRNRAESLGGHIEFVSSPGAGTTVTWTIPGVSR